MQPNTLLGLLSTDIPDPTDFPENKYAPGLRQLDSALRCTVCSELFDAPVTLTCGHCFCSLCARSYIGEKSECPACRKIASEGHLRANSAMEEVVSQWKEARSFVLKLAKAEEERLTTPHGWDQRPKTPRTIKKRKRSRSQEIHVGSSSDGDIEFIPGPSSISISKKIRRHASEDDEVEGHLPIPTSDSQEEELADGDNGDDDFVTCPICGKRLKERMINTHLDNNCKDPPRPSLANGKGQKKSNSGGADVKGQWNKLMSGGGRIGKEKETEPTEPLPKASYAVLKDRQLREMLAGHKLPTTGEKNVLIARHSRWVMIFNANLDKAPSRRRSLADLRSDLKQWDEQQRAQAKKRDKEKEKGGIVGDDAVGYQQANRSEFEELIKIARHSKSKMSEKLPSSSLVAELASSSSSSISTVERTLSESRPGDAEDITVAESEEDRLNGAMDS